MSIQATRIRPVTPCSNGARLCDRCGIEYQAWANGHRQRKDCRSLTCARGHDRTEENTYVAPRTGQHGCIPCRNIAKAKARNTP